VLFLDELLEISRPVLETLRQPLEERSIAIVGARRTVSFPALFELVAATNPCPCGHLGNPRRTCTCSQLRIESYRARLSGPLLDRIDLHVHVPALAYRDVAALEPGEARASVRTWVEAARTGSGQRARDPRPNATLPTRALAEVVQLGRRGRPPAGTGGGMAGAVGAGHRSRPPGGPHHRRS
jgi:magnesium chelatase family protein